MSEVPASVTATPTPATTAATTEALVPETKYEKKVPGSTIRCLEDPSFESEPRPIATDDVDKARDRFDRFWGASNDGGNL